MSEDTFVTISERQKLYTNWKEFVKNVVIPLHWPEAIDATPEQRNHAWGCWQSEPVEYKWAVMMFAWAAACPEEAEKLKEADREGSTERG